MESSLLNDLMHVDLPLLEKVVRPVLVYFFLVIALRLAGKRELAQLNPFDLVVLLTLSNTVQNAIIGADNSLLGGLIGATTLLLVNYIVVRFLYVHPGLDRVLEGAPAVLIEQGQIQPALLKEEVITVAELEEAAHKQGFESLSIIERAVLEPGGVITFIKKQPAAADLRYEDLVRRLDAIAQSITALQPRKS